MKTPKRGAQGAGIGGGGFPWHWYGDHHRQRCCGQCHRRRGVVLCRQRSAWQCMGEYISGNAGQRRRKGGANGAGMAAVAHQQEMRTPLKAVSTVGANWRGRRCRGRRRRDRRRRGHPEPCHHPQQRRRFRTCPLWAVPRSRVRDGEDASKRGGAAIGSGALISSDEITMEAMPTSPLRVAVAPSLLLQA